MFQTKLDRWLRENFVYEHHIKVIHLPEKLPMGVVVSELKSMQYHYLLTIKNKSKAEKLIEDLKDQGNVFSTRIAEGSHWYNPFINSKNKSFTFSVFWWMVTLCVGFYLVLKIRVFLKSDLYFDLTQQLDMLLGR